MGARHINEAVVALKDELLARPNLHIVHITGPKELDAVTEALALTDDEARRWHLLGYQDRMGETLAAADAIVSRAGRHLARGDFRAGHPGPARALSLRHGRTIRPRNARACVESGCRVHAARRRAWEATEFKAKLVALAQATRRVRERMVAAARAQKTGRGGGRHWQMLWWRRRAAAR